MISICIPVFNYDITKLVVVLTKEINCMSEDVELIIIDDGSDDYYKELNKKCLRDCIYIELSKNIGRSKIRNLFVQHAKNSFLIFLDCDVEIVSNEFLKKYVETIQKNDFDVICGGLVYAKEIPNKTHQLRWLYGIERECRSIDERQKRPYSSFMSSNFLVKKEILQGNPFDERIEEYGHEDTLFGVDMKKASRKIRHIENPVLHADKENNEIFVLKTEKAVQNLLHILELQKHKEDFIQSIKLLSYVRKIRKYKMGFLVIFIFKITKNSLKKGLINGEITNLLLFDFYKLGILLEHK